MFKNQSLPHGNELYIAYISIHMTSPDANDKYDVPLSLSRCTYDIFWSPHYYHHTTPRSSHDLSRAHKSFLFLAHCQFYQNPLRIMD